MAFFAEFPVGKAKLCCGFFEKCGMDLQRRKGSEMRFTCSLQKLGLCRFILHIAQKEYDTHNKPDDKIG